MVSTDTDFGDSLGLTFTFKPLVCVFSVHCKTGSSCIFFHMGSVLANECLLCVVCFHLLASAFDPLFDPAGPFSYS